MRLQQISQYPQMQKTYQQLLVSVQQPHQMVWHPFPIGPNLSSLATNPNWPARLQIIFAKPASYRPTWHILQESIGSHAKCPAAAQAQKCKHKEPKQLVLLPQMSYPQLLMHILAQHKFLTMYGLEFPSY